MACHQTAPDAVVLRGRIDRDGRDSYENACSGPGARPAAGNVAKTRIERIV